MKAIGATDSPEQTREGMNLARFLSRATILSSVLVVLAVAVGAVSFFLKGPTGVVVTGLSMGVCLVCGVLALLVSEALKDPRQVMYQVLLTMALRMGIPLTVCLVVHVVGGTLADAGMIYYLLAFYLVTLLVETLLTVNRQVLARPNVPKSAKA